MLRKRNGLGLVHGTRIDRGRARRRTLAPVVRASADSLTCGLLQVKSARSSATSSTFTATRKEFTRLVTGTLYFNCTLGAELFLPLCVLDHFKVASAREGGGVVCKSSFVRFALSSN